MIQKQCPYGDKMRSSPENFEMIVRKKSVILKHSETRRDLPWQGKAWVQNTRV